MRLAALLACLPLSGFCQSLDLPANAVLSFEDVTPLGSYAMPTGPWTRDGLPVLTAEGEVRQQSWRVDAVGLTPLQLLDPLKEQLLQLGFTPVFTCTDVECGGFDFRFATPVVEAPAMYVDLGNYRYIAFQRMSDTGPALISLLASRSTSAGYLQITRVGRAEDTPNVAATAPSARAIAPVVTGELAQELEAHGRVILSDLTFETGSAQLGTGDFNTLRALADYLRANPERQIALVGHTDATGSLDGNITLSKRRAQSVMQRLIDSYDVPSRQVAAEGMGYLSPVATNVTPEGRDANRRVEVILTSTE